METVDKKQQIANYIQKILTEKGMSRVDFAKLMNKQPSVITQWLSGTHNFTMCTLIDIEFALGIRILNVVGRETPRRTIRLIYTANGQTTYFQPA